MGLDVYLYRYENHEAQKAAEAKYEELTAGIWSDGGLRDKLVAEKLAEQTEEEKQAAEQRWLAKRATSPFPSLNPADVKTDPYNFLTEENQKAVQDAIRAFEQKAQEETGTGKYGESGEKIEMKSRLHPNHYCEIGYLRSSYNSGGLNSVLRNVLGEDRDLYYIFQPNNEYEFRPDWKAALGRAKEIRDDLEMVALNWPFQAGTFDAGFNNTGPISDDHFRVIVDRELARSAERVAKEREHFEEAETKRIEALKREGETDPEKLARRPFVSMFGESYMNRDGTFYMGEPSGKPMKGGIELIAACVGTDNRGTPTLYMAHRTDPTRREQYEVKTMPWAPVANSKEKALEVFRAAWERAEATSDGPAADGSAMIHLKGERRLLAESGLFFIPENPSEFRFGQEGDVDAEGGSSGGLQVLAVVPGAEYRSISFFAIFVNTMAWYRQALDIVVEMCEWVLAQEKPEQFYLHWSS